MEPRELVRRSLFASIGLLASSCAADARTSAGGEIDVTPTSTASEVASTAPSSSTRTPVKVPGVGYITEVNGTVHRAGPATCDPKIDAPSCNGTESQLDCKTDADCKEHPHGKCASWTGQFRKMDGCSCQYSCESDADCSEPGTVCACKEATKEPRSQCVEAKCKSDDDCKGSVCGLSTYFNGCGTEITLACRSPKDACQAKSDCKDGQTCAVREDTWMCQGISCAIGRPFTVDGAWASAPPRGRGDWSIEGLSVRDAGRADRWLEMAALEHASVASFARFSLQLLALGAPSALVRATQEAALDEIAHARIAYGIASRIAGREIGPGEFPQAALGIELDVAEVTRALVLEACVGETIGAIEAFESRDAARDPALGALLDRIATDELRHAELAYRCLAWLVDTYGAIARDAALDALASARVTGRSLEIADVVGPAVRASVRA